MTNCTSSLSTLLSTGADITCLIQNDLSAKILMHIASTVNSLSQDTFCAELSQNRKTEQTLCRNSFTQKSFIINSLCTRKSLSAAKSTHSELTDLPKVCRKFHLQLSA